MADEKRFSIKLQNYSNMASVDSKTCMDAILERAFAV